MFNNIEEYDIFKEKMITTIGFYIGASSLCATMLLIIPDANQEAIASIALMVPFIMYWITSYPLHKCMFSKENPLNFPTWHKFIVGSIDAVVTVLLLVVMYWFWG